MTKKKLTLKELIENKELIYRKTQKKKTEVLHLEQFGSSITIEEPDESIVNDSFEMAQSDTGDGDVFLVYNSVIEPNLKDPELLKIYECSEPTDIVSHIFDPGTVRGIAEKCIALAGFASKVTTVEKLKN